MGRVRQSLTAFGVVALAAMLSPFLPQGTPVMAQTAADEHADHEAALKNPDGSWKYTNALANETSPYLLQHAHNPVDWRPWGPEAFEKARREQKPIFLSIGYSTCYWCHVMERQSFENPAIAAVLNEHVVSIKVDREERPDIDDVYMTATQMTTGHGGWPMSVFLTPPGAKGENDPGLKPFHCGTYYPPEPMHGRPGFPQLVEAIGRAWKERRGEVVEQADRIAEAVKAYMEQRSDAPPGPLSPEPVRRAANQLLRLYDREHGGFGTAPKFPTPTYLFFLLAVHDNNPDPSLWGVIRHTLDRMARGGMYDQVGGGFHRYSVDEKWLVPHFEKMLYDNGQLVELYAEAYARASDEQERRLYARIIREACDYVLREMRDETGAFWSAQDAEVETREGGNYVWTREQVEAAIDDEGLCRLAVTMYGLDRGTNFQDPHHPDAQPVNVLYLPRSLDALAEEMGVVVDEIDAQRHRINARLKEVRDDRPQPATDDKVLTSWNGMMIAALAEAGRVLKEPRYVEAAGAAADAVVERMAVEGERFGLHRTMRNGEAKVPAFLEDYAFLVHGLIELYRTQPDSPARDRWMTLAKGYTQAAIDRFASPHDAGGYFDALASGGDLFVRTRNTSDGAIPSGNSQMVHNLLDLHELTGEASYLDRAVRDLRSAADALQQHGANMSHMQHALLRLLERAPEYAEAGEEAAPVAQAGPVTASVQPRTLILGPGKSGVAEITLRIDEAYHLNAHEPTLPDLIGTEVRLDGGRGVRVEVEYPEPASRRFAFAEEPLAVYEGEVKLYARVFLDETAHRVDDARLVLRFQACDDAACLPPRELTLPVTLQSPR